MEALGLENASLCGGGSKCLQASKSVAAGAVRVSEASAELDNLLNQVDTKMRNLEVAMHGLCGRAKNARLILAMDAGLAQADAADSNMEWKQKSSENKNSVDEGKENVGVAVMTSKVRALSGESEAQLVSDAKYLSRLGFWEAWDKRDECAQLLLLDLPRAGDDLLSLSTACQASLAVAEKAAAEENNHRNAAEERCRALERELSYLKSVEWRRENKDSVDRGLPVEQAAVKDVAENASHLHNGAEALTAAQMLNKTLEGQVAEMRAKGLVLQEELSSKNRLVEELHSSLTCEINQRAAAEVRALALEREVGRLQDDLARLQAENVSSREGAAAAAELSQQASNDEIAAAEGRCQFLEKELKSTRSQLNTIFPDYLQLKNALAEAEAGKRREEARAHKAEVMQGDHETVALLHAEARNANLERDVSRLRADLLQAQMELRNWKKAVAHDAYRALADEVRVACRNRMAAISAEKTRSEESLCLSDCDDAFSDRSVRSESSDGNWFPNALSGLALGRATRSFSVGSFLESCRCGAGEVEALALATVLANEEADCLRAEMVAFRGMLEMYQEDAEALQREVEIHNAQMELYEEGCQLEIPPNSCTQQACKGYCERLGRGRGCKYNHDCQIPGCRTRKLHGHAAHKRWLEKHNPKEAAALAASLPAAAKPSPLPMVPQQSSAPLSISGGSSISSSPSTVSGSPVTWFSPGNSPAPPMGLFPSIGMPAPCRNGHGNSTPPPFMNPAAIHGNLSFLDGPHDRTKAGGNRPSTPSAYGVRSVGSIRPPNVNPMVMRMSGAVC